jgi:hypothetical protein
LETYLVLDRDLRKKRMLGVAPRCSAWTAKGSLTPHPQTIELSNSANLRRRSQAR